MIENGANDISSRSRNPSHKPIVFDMSPAPVAASHIVSDPVSAASVVRLSTLSRLESALVRLSSGRVSLDRVLLTHAGRTLVQDRDIGYLRVSHDIVVVFCFVLVLTGSYAYCRSTWMITLVALSSYMVLKRHFVSILCMVQSLLRVCDHFPPRSVYVLR